MTSSNPSQSGAGQAQQQAVQITLQSPTTGAVSDPVPVQANLASAAGLSRWAVNVDGQDVYQANVSAGKSAVVSTQVSVGTGDHTLVVEAWDASGNPGSSAPMAISVGAASAAGAGLPKPPVNATVLKQIQNTTDNWTDCSICAQGTHRTTNYWQAPFQTRPSMTGSSREFFSGGPSWTNVLFIKTLPPQNQASHFIWDFYVYHDGASAASIWSAEFDLWQVIGGREFMIGSQCAFGDTKWETWDSQHNRWIKTGIGCPRWAPNTWHHVQWYVERRGQSQYRYDTLVVDGTPHSINLTYNIARVPWPDNVGIQWQLDQSSNGVPIHEWIDDVQLTMW